MYDKKTLEMITYIHWIGWYWVHFDAIVQLKINQKTANLLNANKY